MNQADMGAPVSGSRALEDSSTTRILFRHLERSAGYMRSALLSRTSPWGLTTTSSWSGRAVLYSLASWQSRGVLPICFFPMMMTSLGSGGGAMAFSPLLVLVPAVVVVDRGEFS